MDSFKVSGLEVQIDDGKRCRLVKTKGGVRTEGDWMSLPLQESELSITTSPASDLAIAVEAYDRLEIRPTNLRALLTKTK